MKNKLQIIGNKVYYDMELVATLNELNFSRSFYNFNLKMLNHFDQVQEEDNA